MNKDIRATFVENKNPRDLLKILKEDLEMTKELLLTNKDILDIRFYQGKARCLKEYLTLLTNAISK